MCTLQREHTRLEKSGVVLVSILFLLFSGNSFSQSFGFYKGSDCVFNTLDNITAGCTSSNYIFVQYQGFSGGFSLPAGWTLKVQANGDFTNGTATIPAQYVSIGFNSADGGPPGVSGTGNQALSKTTPAALINTTSQGSPPYYYFVHKLDMTITGGNHLLVGTGTFSTTLTLTVVAQNGTIVASNNNVGVSFTVNYSNSCTGATIGGYTGNQYTFSNYSDQMAGRTVTDAVTIQYAPNAAGCTGWSLKVRADGNFVNGSNTIPVQYFALSFNRVSTGVPTAAQIGVTNNPVTLSNIDVPLINQSNKGFTPYSGTEHKFDFVITGGNHLLVPNGTYKVNLVFSLYNQSNQLVSTKVMEIAFQINSSTNTYTVVFQNSADVVSMLFNTLADFTNGVSVTKSKGLKITGYSPYQVFIKTSGASLEGVGGNTIPVSVVNLQAVKFTNTTGTVTTYTRTLSAADQLLISNPMTDYTHQVVEYDLKYFTTPGDSRLVGKNGVFSTTVLFVTLPQ